MSIKYLEIDKCLKLKWNIYGFHTTTFIMVAYKTCGGWKNDE